MLSGIFSFERELTHRARERDKSDAWVQLLDPADDELERIQKDLGGMRTSFYSRYVISDLLWKSDALAEDNTALLARALYGGGRIISDQDPQAADRFYKALVNRCRELPIGQEADKLRWFPKTPPPLPEGMPALKR